MKITNPNVHYDSFWRGWYHRSVPIECVKIAGLWGRETVLDFGCGTQFLKKLLPDGCVYLGYDIDESLSGIKDFEEFCPDVVFALGVFEHLTEEVLVDCLNKFVASGAKELICAVPSNNWLNSFLEWVFNQDIEHAFTHLMTGKEVCFILARVLGVPVEVKRVCGIHWIARFELKPKEVKEK